MYYIKVDGQRWKVRQAVSLESALRAISHARVSGSVGSKTTHTEYSNCKFTGDLTKSETIVVADVVRVHSDLTEQKPYEPLH